MDIASYYWALYSVGAFITFCSFVFKRLLDDSKKHIIFYGHSRRLELSFLSIAVACYNMACLYMVYICEIPKANSGLTKSVNRASHNANSSLYFIFCIIYV